MAVQLEILIKAVDQASSVIKGIGDSSATSMANLQKAVTGIVLLFEPVTIFQSMSSWR